MKTKIESLAPWISISCMAGAVGMVCAGHTVLEPALNSGKEGVWLLYWSVSAAFAVSTAAFAYLALSSAEQRLSAKPAKANRLVASAAANRFSRPTEQQVEV